MTEAAGVQDNPLFTWDNLPPFDRIEAAHVVPAVTQLLAELEQRLQAIEAEVKPTYAELVQPLDEIHERLHRVWGPVGHLKSVKDSAELREAHQEMQPAVVKFGLRAGQSEPIYKGLKALQEGPEWTKLERAQQRVVEHLIREAEQAGIALEGEARTRFNEIAERLSHLSTEFSNAGLDATKAWSITLTREEEVDGLPQTARAMYAAAHNQAKQADEPEATPEKGPWRVTLAIPSFLAFMKDAKRRDLREKLYRAFLTRASDQSDFPEFDNTARINEILTLRKEKAALLGFKSYAEFSLWGKMAPSVQAVEGLLEELRAAAWDPAVKDHEELEELAKRHGQQEPVAHWDATYWGERLREERFGIKDEELRPYFPLEPVVNGLFALVERLFGVSVKAADCEAPVWHPDVRFYKIYDDAGAHIASFYLDPYSRPEDKRSGAWMNVCRMRQRHADGSLQVPVAYLVCNQTPPTGDTPSLMTFNEVTTLFHEFGHGLHHMLTRMDYPQVAGVAGVEWDAVELPSQFMENWCYHKPTLLGMARHYQTGEPLPDELFTKLEAARTFRAGSMLLRQIMFSMLDMELHTRFEPGGAESVFDVHRRIAERTSVLKPLAEDRFLCSFAHIFAGGYAAGYYSYKWAEVLSADAFAAFEEAGLDNEAAIKEVGRRFRETVLAQGGGEDPMTIYRSFRGREPSTEPLLRHNGLLPQSA